MTAQIGWVYVLANRHKEGLAKIGMTLGSPEARAADYSREHGIQWTVFFKVRTRNPGVVEGSVHARLSGRRLDYPGTREIFKITPADAQLVVLTIVQPILTPEQEAAAAAAERQTAERAAAERARQEAAATASRAAEQEAAHKAAEEWDRKWKTIKRNTMVTAAVIGAGWLGITLLDEHKAALISHPAPIVQATPAYTRPPVPVLAPGMHWESPNGKQMTIAEVEECHQARLHIPLSDATACANGIPNAPAVPTATAPLVSAAPPTPQRLPPVPRPTPRLEDRPADHKAPLVVSSIPTHGCPAGYHAYTDDLAAAFYRITGRHIGYDDCLRMIP